MEQKIRNHGNRFFLPCGRWLEKNAETVVQGWEARLLAATNPNITIVVETKKKRK